LEIEENRQAPDDEAFSDSVRKLEDFHGHGKAEAGSPIRPDLPEPP
jgi:hypothetical protein